MNEELPDAANGWRVEALKLHKRRGWEFYRAYNHVLVRYLAAGDARPLLDLIRNLRRAPRRRAGEFIAAITDSKPLLDGIDGLSDLPLTDMRCRFRHCAPVYEIRISERRGRGRPKADGRDARKSEIRLSLVCGFGALVANRRPSRQFWLDLADALSFTEDGGPDGHSFPFKGELVRTDGKMGRPPDPELGIRDEALHFAVAKKIEDGLKYEAAIEAVRADSEAQHKAGDRGGWPELATIRAAYDKLSRREGTVYS